MDSSAPSSVEQSMLTEARADIALADHKAVMVMTVLGVGFGAVLGGLLAGDWEPKDYRAPGEFIWWVAATFATSAVVCAATAVWPRYSAAEVSQGIFYWGHVATFRTLEQLSEALDKQPPGEVDRTRYQLHQLSRIVQRKYHLVRGSMVLAGVSGVLFLVAVLSG